MKRTVSALLVATMLSLPGGLAPAFADNQMGYQELSVSQASALPKNGGSLGINVGPAQRINSGGLTFELLKVNSVKSGSPGAQAGFKPGDQIIALDGKVFPTVQVFASYIQSLAPGSKVSVDFMPSNGGPENAQRSTVTIGGNGAPAAPAEKQTQGTLTTGEKVAIGVGAVALFGCYKLGCFNRFRRNPAPAH